MKTSVLAPAVALALAASVSPALAEEGTPPAPAAPAPPAERSLVFHRLELRPYAAWSFVPDSLTGASLGADMSIRLSRFFALGIDGDWYAPFNRSRGATPSYPLNASDYSADLDFYIVPWPASAAVGDEPGIFEPYFVGGAGFVRTRPVAVVPTRDFQDSTQWALTAGLGARVFVASYVAVDLEVRDLLYYQLFENSRTDTGPIFIYSPDTHLTNTIQVRLGMSFFLLGG
jgi:opacity protein-like surface antigen